MIIPAFIPILFAGHAAAEACTGQSAGLDPFECSAWQELYDSTNGKSWIRELLAR
jgi:hypothetical protein